jgi:hypothetical protein
MGKRFYIAAVLPGILLMSAVAARADIPPPRPEPPAPAPAPPVNATNTISSVQVEAGVSWWLVAVLGLLVLGLVVALFLVRRRRR